MWTYLSIPGVRIGSYSNYLTFLGMARFFSKVAMIFRTEAFKFCIPNTAMFNIASAMFTELMLLNNSFHKLLLK